MVKSDQTAGGVQQPPEASPAVRKLGRPTLSDAELLDVAVDLFLENGFEGTSIDAIAGAAGMAKRTVYARYSDKETLFKAALRRAIDEWIVPVERLRELETPDLEETLLRIGDLLVANIMSPLGLRLFRLTNAVSSRMPNVAASNVQQGTEPTVSFLAELLARRVDFAAHDLFDAREAAQAFIYLVVGGPSSMAAWGVQFDQSAIDRHTRSSIGLFLYGLFARKPTLTEMEKENRRLRQLLTDALLENVALKEKGAPTCSNIGIASTY